MRKTFWKLGLAVGFSLAFRSEGSAKPEPQDYEVFLEAEEAEGLGGFAVLGPPRASACSGQRMLNLWQTGDPPAGVGYYAEYEVDLPGDGDYWAIVWAQGLDTPYTSPFWLIIDGQEIHLTPTRATIPAYWIRYGEDLVPHFVGPVELKGGRHRLILRVNERRTYQDHAYNLIADALAFTRTDPKVRSTPTPARLTVDAASSRGEFRPMTDMSQGGIGEVTHPEFWASMAPKLRSIGIQWVRIDHLWDYYGIVSFTPDGPLQYDWDRFDRVLEQLLAAGARPYFSVSYMPPALSQAGSPYGPPRDYSQWQAICGELARHVKDRWQLTGLYYEIWNEPDLGGFWSGTQEEYLRLYAHASQGILAVDPSAKVGGPASAASGWIEPFLQEVKKQGLRLDFVSWHYYDWSCQPQVYAGQIVAIQDQLAALGFPPTVETIISEWNLNADKVAHNDRFYNAGHCLAALWVFHQNRLSRSFFFMPKDAQGPSELFGMWGALTFTNQPKPAYHAFDAYARLKGQRVAVETSDSRVQALAVRDVFD